MHSCGLLKKYFQHALLNCLNGKCSLYQKILDYNCKLQGHSCGLNMTFRTIDEEKLGETEIIGVKCTVICECASGFYEKKGQCIVERLQPSNTSAQNNPVRNRNLSSDLKNSLQKFCNVLFSKKNF